MVFGGGLFAGFLGHEGRALMMGIMPLSVETRETVFSLSSIEGYKEKSILQSAIQKRALTRAWSYWHSELTLSASRTAQNKCLLISHPVYSILLWLPNDKDICFWNPLDFRKIRNVSRLLLTIETWICLCIDLIEGEDLEYHCCLRWGIGKYEEFSIIFLRMTHHKLIWISLISQNFHLLGLFHTYLNPPHPAHLGNIS